MAQQIVQAVHAAHDAGRFFSNDTDQVPSVVVCRTPTEDSLLREADKLKMRGIQTTIFYEPDRGGEATAIATESLGSEYRRTFNKWKLWKGD